MLPQDPSILFSYINTKLRDEFSSLEALCDALEIDQETLKETLHEAGFDYDEVANRFH